MASTNSWARYEPYLRYKNVSSSTFVSTNSVVVADTEVSANSVIIFIPKAAPIGVWFLQSKTAGVGFTIGSTDAENNIAFDYIIL